MSAQEEKDSILQLPLPERTVAVALKHIFDQIRAIEQEQAQETQAIKDYEEALKTYEAAKEAGEKVKDR